MSDAPDYHLATNKAYETLRNLNIQSLPIDIVQIMSHFSNLELMTYSQLRKRFHLSKSDLFALGVSDYGFTLKKPRTYIVLYNDEQDECIIRFTLAHELGHIYLLHVEECQKTDREANCFARNFLCPIPVVDLWKLDDLNDYIDIFNVSPPMAETSLNLRNVDLYHISGQNYNAMVNLFSLRTLTKQVQLNNFSARYKQCLSDFAGIV